MGKSKIVRDFIVIAGIVIAVFTLDKFGIFPLIIFIPILGISTLVDLWILLSKKFDFDKWVVFMKMLYNLGALICILFAKSFYELAKIEPKQFTAYIVFSLLGAIFMVISGKYSRDSIEIKTKPEDKESHEPKEEE